MKRIKMMLMAAVAVLAVGAVGASAANAAGTATVTLVGTGSCDVSFDSSAWSGSPSSSSTVSNIVVAPGGTCDVETVTGSGALQRDTTSTAASFGGTFHIETFFGLIQCDYTGSVSGTWGTSGSQYSFNMPSGTATLLSGSGACPTNPNLSMTALVDA